VDLVYPTILRNDYLLWECSFLTTFRDASLAVVHVSESDITGRTSIDPPTRIVGMRVAMEMA
jgi:hypothetical protein